MIFRVLCSGLLAFFLFVLLAGCSGGMRGLQEDVRRLEGEIADLRGMQAEHTAEVSALRSRLNSVVGDIEVLEHHQRAKYGGQLNKIESEMSTLQRRVPPPAIVPTIALEADEVLADSLPSNVGTLLKNALQEIRRGTFREAAPLLEEGETLSYGNSYQGTFLFWKGVTAEGLSQNKDAIRIYHTLISQFPQHARTPLGLLRQSSVFVRIGDTTMAKVTLQKIIENYSKSTEAARAREKIRDFR